MRNLVRKKRTLDVDKWIIAFVILLSITAIIKIIAIMRIPGPVVYGDELLYKKRAMELFYEHKYYSSSYPLGYPLIVSIAFLFDHFYFAMKVINIVLAAIAYMAIWKLCRLFIDRKNSFFCVLIVSLLPWQYSVCSKVMSENLYFPLLFWALYFFAKTLFVQKVSVKECVFCGMILAAMQLTRHITIVILPVFALFWIIDLKENGRWYLNLGKEKIITGFAVLGGYLLIYGGWVISRVVYGEEFEYVIGLQISNGVGSSAIDEYATGTSLVYISILYFSYMILNVLYTCSVNFVALHKSIKGKIERNYAKILVLFIGITVMLMVAAVRHSWRSAYNYPQVAYIIGRYILYISAIWIVMAKIFENKVDMSDDRKKLLIYQVIDSVLIIFAVLILIKDCFFNLGQDFLNNVNTKETYYLYYLYWVVIVLSMAMIIILIWHRKWYMKSLNGALLITFLFGSVISLGYDDYERRGGFGAVFDEFLNDKSDEQYNFIINDTPAIDFVNDIEFWSTPKSHLLLAKNNVDEISMLQDMGIASDEEENYYEDYSGIYVFNKEADSEYIEDMQEPRGLIYCEISDDYKEIPIYTYEYHGKAYGIYNYPIELKAHAQILQTYPELIYVGEKFNAIDNTSVLALSTDAEEGVYGVLLNGEYYDDIAIGENGHGSIYITDEYYLEEGAITIQLIKAQSPSYVNAVVSDVFEIVVTDGVHSILQAYPDVISCGVPFNADDKGNASLAIQTEAEAGVYAIWINGEYYGDIAIGANGLGSIIIEPQYYEKEGVLYIQMQDTRYDEFIAGKDVYKILITAGEKK